MAGALYSPSWYRVAGLCPQLRAHVQVHRQSFRGKVWHVVQDNQTGRFHRLSTPAYHVVCLMDGNRTVDDIWRLICDRPGGAQPTQEDVVRLLSLLHGSDLILGGVQPHLEDLAERAGRQARRDFVSRFRNPLAIRIPLLDPDRLLTATLPFVRPLFTIWGLLAWMVLLMAGLTLAVTNWRQMTGAAFDSVFLAHNVLLIVLLYPCIKLLHEMGHAYATKVWGGEVHEFGVMLLAFMPVPYVDASASTAFPQKTRRALVGAAGILVEVALAALAMIVWVLAEPGMARAVAFNVVVTCGLSTVLFNGNPLLRFDGYYVLSDLMEVPNLGQRANQYLKHLFQRHAFGLPDRETPVTAPGEPAIFVFYAIGSFIYRTIVMVGVAFFIATHFFVVGVLLACASVAGTIVWPALKALHFVLFSPQLAGHRGRAVSVAFGTAGAVAIVLMAIPFPYSTMAEGIVWVSDEEATLRVRTAGFVSDIPAEGLSDVAQGTLLMRLEDPFLQLKADVAEKELEELQIKLEAVNLSDRVGANILREQIRQSGAKLADMRRSLDELALVAPSAGRLLMMDTTDLPGRFQRKGEVVGYIVGQEGLVVRAFVPQGAIDLVRRNTRAVSVRLASDKADILKAAVTREVPAAVADLPHPALATSGGGQILIDPAKPEKLKPLDSLFEVDLRVADLPADARIGMRAYVRFEHAAEPLAVRWLREVRQVFLRHFNV
ncbi:peptidase M50 [Aquabacter cavernae]|uniref:peptidase M50 n=1 Tax=Aquabacter cavernae TaxID=2496029 RepID=UPI000F8D1DD0|nr:peptidase M50 [Aquabacter cavernae]